MAVTVRFLSGDRTGEKIAFDDAKETITFGRNPVTCDVVFAPAQVRVSREHFTLRRVLGAYQVVTNRNSPVFRDEELLGDDDVLDGAHTVRLGRHGPRVFIEIEIPGNESLAATQRNGPLIRRPSVSTEIRKVSKSVRWQRIGLMIAIPVILVMSAVVFRQDRALRAAGKRSAALEQVKPAVYLVLGGRTGESPAPFATAWVVDRDRGLLATNAHVAMRSERGPLFLRSQESRDFEVISVDIHPKYRQGNQDSYSVYDVALLHVAEKHRRYLSSAIPLATRDELRELSIQDGLHYWGFPLESVPRNAFDPENPEPVLQHGDLIGRSPIDNSPFSDKSTLDLLVHNLAMSGGASGSPLLNDEARVVGILNAASGELLEDRMVNNQVYNMAQSIRLLWELLEEETR